MTEGKEVRLIEFDGTPAERMLNKLRREIQEIESAMDPELARDQVTNAFWTAWHLHTWIWDEIKDRPELKAAVFNYRGIGDEEVDDERSFGAALAQRFVPLKICRLIATSPKLIRVVLPITEDDRTRLSTIEGAEAGSGSAMQALSVLASTRTRSVCMIVLMGKLVAATRILREIDDYWVTLIHECRLEQLR